MSDEEDYMSDTFLTGMIDKDIRPGLIHNRSDKRSHDELKKRIQLQEENKTKSLTKKSDSEKLKTALEQPITSENKGFALLQKMGFNPGSGLGKTGDGRKEPVPIELKNDRYGLGRKTALKEVAAMKLALCAAKQKKSEETTENYLTMVRERISERVVVSDLSRSQRICLDLDSKNGITEPGESWFWPPRETEKKRRKEQENDDAESGEDDDDDEEEEETDKNDDDESEEEEEENDLEFTSSEKLQVITLYLRKTHCYCIWCGTQFDDEKDLQMECPGPTRDDH